MSYRYDIGNLSKQQQIIINNRDKREREYCNSKEEKVSMQEIDKKFVLKKMNVNQKYLVIDISKQLNIEVEKVRGYLNKLVSDGLIVREKYGNDKRKYTYKRNR